MMPTICCPNGQPLSIPEGTVKSRGYYSLRQLKRLLSAASVSRPAATRALAPGERWPCLKLADAGRGQACCGDAGNSRTAADKAAIARTNNGG
jgi:hypothetical protein